MRRNSLPPKAPCSQVPVSGGAMPCKIFCRSPVSNLACSANSIASPRVRVSSPFAWAAEFFACLKSSNSWTTLLLISPLSYRACTTSSEVRCGFPSARRALICCKTRSSSLYACTTAASGKVLASSSVIGSSFVVSGARASCSPWTMFAEFRAAATRSDSSTLIPAAPSFLACLSRRATSSRKMKTITRIANGQITEPMTLALN
jgi:hypothetical protein